MNHLKSSRLAKGAAVVAVDIGALLVEIIFFFLIENISNKKLMLTLGKHQ
jgi:hypothetical protein